MIYTDKFNWVKSGKFRTDIFGHLVTDGDIEELHEFASSIGLRKEWFQNKRYPHYDLIGINAIQRAIDNGAKLISSKELITIVRGK